MFKQVMTKIVILLLLCFVFSMTVASVNANDKGNFTTSATDNSATVNPDPGNPYNSTTQGNNTTMGTVSYGNNTNPS